jgi:hypothetical protein
MLRQTNHIHISKTSSIIPVLILFSNYAQVLRLSFVLLFFTMPSQASSFDHSVLDMWWRMKNIFKIPNYLLPHYASIFSSGPFLLWVWIQVYFPVVRTKEYHKAHANVWAVGCLNWAILKRRKGPVLEYYILPYFQCTEVSKQYRL